MMHTGPKLEVHGFTLLDCELESLDSQEVFREVLLECVCVQCPFSKIHFEFL